MSRRQHNKFSGSQYNNGGFPGYGGNTSSHIEADEMMARRLQDELYAEEAMLARQMSGMTIAGPSASYHSQQYASSSSNAAFSQPHQSKSSSAQPQLHAHQAHGGQDTADIQRFVKAMQMTACPKCDKALIPDIEALTAAFRNIFQAKGYETTHVNCTTCGQAVCMGCRRIGDARQLCNCGRANGRLFVIWATLCGFDAFLEQDIHEEQQRSLSQGPRKPIREGEGTGYGGSDSRNISAFGIRYGGPQSQGSHGKQRHQTPLSTTDQQWSIIMRVLSRWLPNLKNAQPASFDRDPHGVLLAMLLRSRILDKAAELLRNDSIDDIVRRVEVYSNLVAFVSVLAGHPKTGTTVTSERIVYGPGNGILAISFASAAIVDSDKSETRPSIASVTSNIAIQCSAMLKKQRDDGSEFFQILEAFDSLNKTLQSKAPQASLVKSIQQLPAVAEVPDRQLLQYFHFASEARSIQNPHPQRQRTLMKEVASMMTSLPPGIYVRHGESRPDVLKAIIIGSSDPYEHGIFEFDLFCGPDYPRSPPKVFYHAPTELLGQHSVEMNPNLHNVGMVCLSLLGTWSGEPWRPGVSTLLQVLISIQSLILCENPIYNEPGNERLVRGSPDAKFIEAAANMFFRGLTVRFTILKWLQPDKLQHPIWGGVVSLHWQQNAGKILQMVKRWADEELEAQERYERGQWPQPPHRIPGSLRRVYSPPKSDVSRYYNALAKAMQQFMRR